MKLSNTKKNELTMNGLHDVLVKSWTTYSFHPKTHDAVTITLVKGAENLYFARITFVKLCGIRKATREENSLRRMICIADLQSQIAVGWVQLRSWEHFPSDDELG